MRLEGFMRGGEGPERVRCCWRIVNMKAWVFHESMVSIHYNTNCHESGAISWMQEAAWRRSCVICTRSLGVW
jgi:hypothetical protein